MHARGFTLIELMIALAIASILLMVAAPLYGTWVADNQIKAGAQLIADGLRFAQGEAIKRNAQVEFILDKTSKTGGWAVQLPGDVPFQQGHFSEGADRATFTVTPAGRDTVTFTGIGLIQNPNADGTAPFQQVDVTSSVSGSRTLRIQLFVGNQMRVKICDPAWPATDPKGCPP
jgi:type IV fimbrial biogenesis protein FimT